MCIWTMQKNNAGAVKSNANYKMAEECKKFAKTKTNEARLKMTKGFVARKRAKYSWPNQNNALKQVWYWQK